MWRTRRYTLQFLLYRLQRCILWKLQTRAWWWRPQSSPSKFFFFFFWLMVVLFFWTWWRKCWWLGQRLIPLFDWPAQRPKCFKKLCYWNCFKISRIWRNSHLSDMLFSQKFQWGLLLQDCFNIQKCDPMFMTKDIASDKGHFEVFPKEKKKDSSLCLWSYFFDLVMLCYILSCFSWHILLQEQEFWVLQLIPHVLGTKIEI